MDERKAVQRVIGRMYRHYEKVLGRTPDGKTARALEEKARKAAETADRRKRRG